MFHYSRNIRDFSLSNGLSRYSYFRPRYAKRPRCRRPCYSYPRHRPTICDRDRRFIDWFRRKQKERERINREDEVSDSEEEEVDPPNVPEAEVSRKLHVTGIDLHIAQNTQNHHTDMYECIEDRVSGYDRSPQKAELVVRRGQPFLMTIKFDRPFDIKKNDVTLTLTLVPGEGKSTVKQTFKVTESKSAPYIPRQWGASLVRKEGIVLTLDVFVPATAPVGAWELAVRTIVDVEDDDKDLIWQYKHNEEINILFNPWCKEDVVYLSDQAWLNEAVLNDSGAVFWGTHRQIGSSSWAYGQFDDGILDAALHLLRRGFDFKTSKAMGNAARVARVFSKMVNAPDDDGVLVGNWSENYAGGLSPTAWTGSVKILLQYMKTGKPVKFAQCWVFSHVLTTVCRAVGLPCRSVTNFESAHNTDKDHLSHDEKYFKDINGKLCEVPSGDSIWNFHVWNEVWMSRPDLGREFDGWQAIDATPQETSDGVYCCGPAPVRAIKEGLINNGQDTAFVFAEVNADKVEWLIDPATGDMKVMWRSPNEIGKKISTKTPTGRSGTERLDITDQYKYKEGSPKEREVVRKAERLFRHDNLDVPDEEPAPAKPVELEIVEKDDIYVGSGFDVEVVAINSSDKQRTINLAVKVSHKAYYGVTTGKAIKKEFNNEKLDAGERRTFVLEITTKQALSHPKDGFNFHIKAVAEVAETDNIVTKTTTFRLRRPDILVKGSPSVKIGENIDVELSFTNPLPVLMTNCEIDIEGNLKPVQASSFRIGHIRAGETWTTTIKMVPAPAPRLAQERNASFGLESDLLKGIIGSFTVQLR